MLFRRFAAVAGSGRTVLTWSMAMLFRRFAAFAGPMQHGSHVVLGYVVSPFSGLG